MRGQAVLLHLPEHRWECLACEVTSVTRETEPHSRLHPCRGARGLMIPMVPVGTRGQVTLVEREDYVGGEIIQRDGEGRPTAFAVLTRDDGQDVVAYAPTAAATSRGLDIDPAIFKERRP